MKYLYVLVSDTNDYYLEQAVMSIFSLKMKNPDRFVSLLVDVSTEKSLTGKRRGILDLVDEFKTITIDNTFSKKARSRWLKTTMRKHISGDFLYIDCDTIIADNLADIFNSNIELGAVPDAHVPFAVLSNKDYVFSIMKRLGFSFLLDAQYYFNGGLFFCRDTKLCHTFFTEWHRLWLLSYSKNISTDMPSLNQANINLDQCIIELDGKWNCQLLQGGLPYLADTKIIHYFSSNNRENPYLLAKKSIFETIRTQGITQDIKEKLEHPKSLFSLSTRLIADMDTLSVIDSLSFFIGRPALVHFLHSCSSKVRSIKNKIEKI